MFSLLKKIFWYPFSTKQEIESYQTIIRDLEWNEFKKYIKPNQRFLDLGCGAGYFLDKASKELNCEVYGIDPSPGKHGVGRYGDSINQNIIKGFAENIDYQDEYFDAILCSHVLEHVTDEEKSLSEIRRVLKPDGVLIIGMPTASMSIIAVFSHYFFTTHANIYHFILSIGKKESYKKLLHTLIPTSHSAPNHRFIFYDLYKYRIKQWRKVVSRVFSIESELKPYLYPYPDYIQFFKPKKMKNFSSSIFFICKKNKN